MQKYNDFYTAYNFLATHPMVCEDRSSKEAMELSNHFRDCLDVEVVKVNPNLIDDGLRCIDFDHPENNTMTEVWLEFGDWDYYEDIGRCCPSHDIDLDTGAETFEEAIIKLANLVSQKKEYQDLIKPGK